MLTIASQLYAFGARTRRSVARRHPDRARRLSRPVVSVGNLAVGGTGKTPLVAFIAGRLLAAGERPAILSRGYGRRLPDDGVTVVSDGARLLADLYRAGDEPLMLARRLPKVPVVVSADRYLAGRLAELALGATVHILDDGFQHFGLARDVDLVLVDPADLEHPRTLPAGRLREPVSVLQDADALLVTDPSADLADLAARTGARRAFGLVRQGGAAVEDALDGIHQVPRGCRVVLVSGIARPERFEVEVRAAGYDVAAAVAFRDHHRYTPDDVARVSREVSAVGAALVLTTDKDLMRLLPLRPWPFRVAVRPLAVHVAGDEFEPWLLGRVRSARGERAPEPDA